MVKRIKKVTKGKVTRERKKIIVVGTEGQNKTEVLYLRELEKSRTNIIVSLPRVMRRIRLRSSETLPRRLRKKICPLKTEIWLLVYLILT